MQSFQKVITSQLIPSTKSGAAERIIVARQQMSRAEVPSGVELTHRKLVGERIVVKGRRHYGNTRCISAKWVEAGMHEAENARLIYVIDGSLNFQAGDYLLGCVEGDSILIPPHIPYPGDQYLPNLIHSRIKGHSCSLLWMVPYQRGLQCYLSHYKSGLRENSPRENFLFLNKQVTKIFQLFVEEVVGDKNNQLCDGLLMALFTALQREIMEEHYLHPGPVIEPKNIPSIKDEFVKQLEDYIGRNLDQPMTTEQVARGLYMSRAQFVRRIKQETGRTFIEILTEYRIRQIKILLSESEWTVQTIAQFVGFKSPTYFYAFFQRNEGCTPGEYRRKFRKS